jgi:hypothetical protein
VVHGVTELRPDLAGMPGRHCFVPCSYTPHAGPLYRCRVEVGGRVVGTLVPRSSLRNEDGLAVEPAAGSEHGWVVAEVVPGPPEFILARICLNQLDWVELELEATAVVLPP